MKVFIINGYRFIYSRPDAYLVGVANTYEQAHKIAEFEEDSRCGENSCEIIEVEVFKNFDEDNQEDTEKIRKLDTHKQIKTPIAYT